MSGAWCRDCGIVYPCPDCQPEDCFPHRSQFKAAAHLLRLAADHLSNHVCSDLRWTDLGLGDDLAAFRQSFDRWAKSGDPDHQPDEHIEADWVVMQYLAAVMEEASDE